MGAGAWIWVAFVALLLATMAYGWRSRGWGPPVPRSLVRRRSIAEGRAYDETIGWGWLADLLWAAVVVALVWLVVGLLVTRPSMDSWRPFVR